MKKIKTLLILCAMLLIGFAGKSQVGITFRMNNYMVVPGTTYDTLIFDVEAKGTPGTSYTTTFTIKINFNSAAFGVGYVPTYQQLPLSLPSGYNFNTFVATAGASRFTSSFQANRLASPFTGGLYDITYLSNLTTSYQGIIRYKMVITNPGIPLNVDFFKTGAGSMSANNSQNYILSSGGTTTTNYNPISFEASPTYDNLMFSEIGDPSNSTTNFVEIYNPNSWVVNLNYYPWYLNAGTSSVLLTGIIPAGETYVVAYNNTDFTPDLVSTIVGTGGTTLYRLSYFGNYSSGTLFDIYDGSAAGFAYTGKHAVRHYNIVLPNMTQTASEWVISAAQNVDMTPGSHRSLLNWAGATSGDWHTKTNWGEGFIPDAGHNVAIANAGSTPVISNGDNAYCNDLAIAGDADLIIESLPGLDGSLITFGTVTGNATVQRYLGADRYWYVTPPVTPATANVFLHMWMFTYSGGDWTQFIIPPSTPLNQMQGFAVWTSSLNSWDENPPLGSVTTAYNGVLNTGDESTPLVIDWNFVGNPYPSAVDWTATGWTKTSLVTDAYSVWNGGSYSTYTVGSGGTNGATQFISAGQGFFVQASAAGTLGVTNNVRTHSLQAFFKTDENMANRLSMTISNDTVNDETVIYFNENATSDLDYDYDAPKLMSEATQAYTVLAGEKMAINTFNNYSQTASVTLGVNTPVTRQYTISASNIESFDSSTPLFLQDLVTGEVINLREVSIYTFDAEVGTSERFVVHFTEVQGIDDPTNGEVNGIYAADQKVYVDFNAVKGEISIYNILGREISRSVASNGLNVISVPQGNAVYIVKVISDNVAVTKKVFVK